MADHVRSGGSAGQDDSATMTASMPELPSWQHFASVNYACTFFQLTSSGGLVAFAVPSPVQFVFSFETGRTQPDPQVGLYDVTWDYSWFNQAQVEAEITVALGGISALIGELIGMPRTQIEQAISIQREWTVAANQQGNAAPLQFGPGTGIPVMITEVMPYLVQIAGADAAAAAEESSVAQS